MKTLAGGDTSPPTENEEIRDSAGVEKPAHKNSLAVVGWALLSHFCHGGLSANEALFKNQDYLNLAFFWLTALLFLALLLFLAKAFALFKPTKQKLSSYECGFEPFGDARGKYDILFYVVAILFILFDIEIVLLFPWVITHAEQPIRAYFLIYIFLFTLVLGFAYE